MEPSSLYQMRYIVIDNYVPLWYTIGRLRWGVPVPVGRDNRIGAEALPRMNGGTRLCVGVLFC